MLSLSKQACIAGLLALAACSQETSPPVEGDAIACALDGAESMTRDCTLARRGGETIVYHPDGGFRRFGIEGDRVVALDGADLAESRMLPSNDFEVVIADDRYRIPRDERAR